MPVHWHQSRLNNVGKTSSEIEALMRTNAGRLWLVRRLAERSLLSFETPLLWRFFGTPKVLR